MEVGFGSSLNTIVLFHRGLAFFDSLISLQFFYKEERPDSRVISPPRIGVSFEFSPPTLGVPSFIGGLV